jgi:hypothetical protein
MADYLLKKQWQELIFSMRENYFSAVKALTSHQKEIEGIISDVLKNYCNIQENRLSATYTWVVDSVKKREEYLLAFKEKLYESLSIMPCIEDNLYKNLFVELKSYINDFYSKISGL